MADLKVKGESHNSKTRKSITVQDAMRSVTQEEPAGIPTQAECEGYWVVFWLQIKYFEHSIAGWCLYAVIISTDICEGYYFRYKVYILSILLLDSLSML